MLAETATDYRDARRHATARGRFTACLAGITEVSPGFGLRPAYECGFTPDRSAAERPAAAPPAICLKHVRSILTRTAASCQVPPEPATCVGPRSCSDATSHAATT